jgi:hypothetical protein
MTYKKTLFNSFQKNVVYQSWKEPFNQLQVCNYDPNASLIVNRSIVIPRAILSGGVIYPTVWGYSLNVGEINASAWEFQPEPGTVSANYFINYIIYAD